MLPLSHVHDALRALSVPIVWDWDSERPEPETESKWSRKWLVDLVNSTKSSKFDCLLHVDVVLLKDSD